MSALKMTFNCGINEEAMILTDRGAVQPEASFIEGKQLAAWAHSSMPPAFWDGMMAQIREFDRDPGVRNELLAHLRQMTARIEGERLTEIGSAHADDVEGGAPQTAAHIHRGELLDYIAARTSEFALTLQDHLTGLLAMRAELEKLRDAASAALAIAHSFGQIDGSHHKGWVIDQMVRHLLGDDYEGWVAKHDAGEEGAPHLRMGHGGGAMSPERLAELRDMARLDPGDLPWSIDAYVGSYSQLLEGLRDALAHVDSIQRQLDSLHQAQAEEHEASRLRRLAESYQRELDKESP